MDSMKICAALIKHGHSNFRIHVLEVVNQTASTAKAEADIYTLSGELMGYEEYVIRREDYWYSVVQPSYNEEIFAFLRVP